MFEKKEIDLKYERMNLTDVVNEVVGSMKLQLEKRTAEVNLQQHGDLTMEADRLHLQSVVFNLLDNAIKYSNGSLKIDIVLEEKNDMIIMSVADNGIGIASQYIDKVFEKFFRIPHGDTHDAQGYGLGLSYAAHVIRKHKGSIRVDSEKGKGSRFIIELPKNRI
jgi:two-component system phosphate regulon sensor histidine kinase PhoR